MRISQGKKRALQGTQCQILGGLPIQQAGIFLGNGTMFRGCFGFKKAYLQRRFALLPMGMNCPAQVV